VCASFLHRDDCLRREKIGAHKVMWGSDYPHSEGTYPFSVEGISKTFAGLDRDEVQMMLAGTAAEVYGFDLEALAPVAERVGPTPEDLGQDPSRRTDPEEVARARWWKAEYGLT